VNANDNPANNELRQLPVQMLLERGARLIDSKFAGQPRLQAELYGVVGGIFADMSSPKQAEEYANKQIAALTLLDAHADDQARALILLARALEQQGKLADAELRARRAIVVARANPKLGVEARFALIDVLFAQWRDEGVKSELETVEAVVKGVGDSMARESARAEGMRARLLLRDNRIDLALPIYERAIDAALRAEGPQSRLAVEIRLSHAKALRSIGETDASKRQLAAALATMRALGGADDIGAALAEAEAVTHMFASSFQSRRVVSFEEALAALERIRKRFNESSSQVPGVILAYIDFKLAVVFQDWGDLERARAFFASSVPVLLSQAQAPMTRAQFSFYLGLSAMDRGEHTEADRHLRESLELRKLAVGNSWFLLYDYTNLARNLSLQGRFDEAEAVLASIPKIDPMRGQKVGDPMVYSTAPLKARASVKLDRGEPAAALALLPPNQADNDDYPLEDRRLLRGAALCALGRGGEGLPLMETYTEQAARESFVYHPQVAHWRAVTGLCALDAGNRPRAMQLAGLARQAFTQQPNVSPYYKAPLLTLERRLARR
jgi:eukaryotic-like serine/threonine-protein kinase